MKKLLILFFQLLIGAGLLARSLVSLLRVERGYDTTNVAVGTVQAWQHYRDPVHRAEFVPGASVPLFELRPPLLTGLAWATKRVFDLVVASLLGVLSSLAYLCCMAARTAPGAGSRRCSCWTPRRSRSIEN